MARLLPTPALRYGIVAVFCVVVVGASLADSLVTRGEDNSPTGVAQSDKPVVHGAEVELRPGDETIEFGPFFLTPKSESPLRAIVHGDFSAMSPDAANSAFFAGVLEHPGNWTAKPGGTSLSSSTGVQSVRSARWRAPDGREVTVMVGASGLSTMNIWLELPERYVVQRKMLGDYFAVSRTQTAEFAASLEKPPLTELISFRDGVGVWLESSEFSEQELEQLMLSILYRAN